AAGLDGVDARPHVLYRPAAGGVLVVQLDRDGRVAQVRQQRVRVRLGVRRAAAEHVAAVQSGEVLAHLVPGAGPVRVAVPGALGDLVRGPRESLRAGGGEVEVALVVGYVDAPLDHRCLLVFVGVGGARQHRLRVQPVRSGRVPHVPVPLHMAVRGHAAVGGRVGVDVGDALPGVHVLPLGALRDDVAVDGGAAAAVGGVVEHHPIPEAGGRARVDDGARLDGVDGLTGGPAGPAEVGA